MLGSGSRARLRLVAVACAVPFALVVVMAFWLQVVHGDSLRSRAESQHVKRVRLPAHRGPVLDRQGRELAYSMVNYSILADTRKIDDPAAVAKALGDALGVSPRIFERRLATKRHHVELWTQITPYLDRRIDLESLPGVYETLHLKRIYPLGPSAAHVVGYTGDNGQGLGGVEFTMDDLLRGHPGWATQMRDARGASYQGLGLSHRPASSGHTIELTLDAELQDVAASALERAVALTDAKGGALVALDPATGQILAMASCPSFDPGMRVGVTAEQMRNRVIVDPIEPGSTFKLVAATAALSDGLLDPSSPIHCENGRHDFGPFTVTDHHAYGTLTFRECFAYSSNIAFAKVGQLCNTRLYDVARDFGFGRSTGLSLSGESGGRLYPPERWSGQSSATLAYGYEVMVTPLQMASAFAAVANDGVLMEPQIIKRILGPDGEPVYTAVPHAVRKVMEPSVARTLRDFMRLVVEEGTGKEAAVDWVQVGGKTGTAEKLFNGRYSRTKHYASFAGMAPVDTPRIVCYVMLDEPEGSVYGGSAAAPVFREMLEASSRLPGAWLAPDYPQVTVPTPAVDDRSPWGVAEAVADETQTTALESLPGTEGVPDVRGKSIRHALMILRAHGETAEVRGSGTVTEQVVRADGAARFVLLTGNRPGATAQLALAGGSLRVRGATGDAGPRE